MKRKIAISIGLLSLILVLALTACGGEPEVTPEAETGMEIALDSSNGKSYWTTDGNTWYGTDGNAYETLDGETFSLKPGWNSFLGRENIWGGDGHCYWSTDGNTYYDTDGNAYWTYDGGLSFISAPRDVWSPEGKSYWTTDGNVYWGTDGNAYRSEDGLEFTVMPEYYPGWVGPDGEKWWVYDGESWRPGDDKLWLVTENGAWWSEDGESWSRLVLEDGFPVSLPAGPEDMPPVPGELLLTEATAAPEPRPEPTGKPETAMNEQQLRRGEAILQGVWAQQGPGSGDTEIKYAAQLLDWYMENEGTPADAAACGRWILERSGRDNSAGEPDRLYREAAALWGTEARQRLEAAGYQYTGFPYPMREVRELFSGLYEGLGLDEPCFVRLYLPREGGGLACTAEETDKRSAEDILSLYRRRGIPDEKVRLLSAESGDGMLMLDFGEELRGVLESMSEGEQRDFLNSLALTMLDNLGGDTVLITAEEEPLTLPADTWEKLREEFFRA